MADSRPTLYVYGYLKKQPREPRPLNKEPLTAFGVTIFRERMMKLGYVITDTRADRQVGR